MNLQKQVEVTDEILAQIESITATTVEADQIVVYEAVAASTRPLSKENSFYDKAVMSRAMLEEMAEAVNSAAESVPLHTLHNQSSELPKGKVFQARVTDEYDGSSNLLAMFFLPLEETELVNKINLGILDEVSVGVKSMRALCSKCGFDYFGEAADFLNFFTHTCDNEHTIGENGTHLKLDGVDKWLELSLVSRGASNKPKILSRAKKLVSQEEQDRMAASGTPFEATVLFSSATTMENPEMSEENTENQEFDAEAAIEALTASIPQMIADALAANEAEEEESAESTVEELQAQLDAANAKIAELEAPEEEVETDLPIGGVAASAVEDAKGKTVNHRGASFKLKR